MIAAVREALVLPPEALPAHEPVPEELPPSAQAAAEILKLALKIVCEQHGIAPKLVASASEIEVFAHDSNAEVPMMSGWRREVFGRLALELVAGRAVIGFRDGRAAILDTAGQAAAAE
jgi:ribonuclease D